MLVDFKWFNERHNNKCEGFNWKKALSNPYLLSFKSAYMLPFLSFDKDNWFAMPNFSNHSIITNENIKKRVQIRRNQTKENRNKIQSTRNPSNN